jgi:uncharacterized protein YceK
MKKIWVLAIVLTGGLLLNGCASVLPSGVIYTEVKAPVSVGDGSITYTKVGVSKATTILGLFATGDCSIKAAAANGGIRNIKYVDFGATSILGCGEYTTTVYGD